VLTVQGNTEDLTVHLTNDVDWKSSDRYTANPMSTKDEYLYYQYMDKKQQTMYLKLSSVMSKECFQYMHKNNWPDFDEQLADFYKWILKKEMPQDMDKAIEDLPCYAETFRNMLTGMKSNKSANLIIDLRTNGGGWTPITLPTLYMLFGDEYLNKDMETNFYRIISPLYMQKIGMTLENYNQNQNSTYQYGDYIFSEEDEQSETQEQEQKREYFIHNAIGNSGFYIQDQKGQAVYTPQKIYVLTDANTFSAAFHYAFYLWKMGATIVGVPSSQAPNTFMEITEFELPYTHLKGTISNSAQYFLPVNDKRAKIFYPDLMLNYDDYRKYNFNQDTELLWLMDYINSK
jgi:hypothetical protein